MVVALLTFDDGTLAVLENTWGTPQVMGPVPNMVLQARGTKGVIDLSPANTGAIVFTPESVRTIDAIHRSLETGEEIAL